MFNPLCWIVGHVFNRHGAYLVCCYCGKRIEVGR